MGTTQVEYTKRLPYCWAWDEETRTEYLLHRGYHAVAQRPADEPWKAVILPGTEHPKHTWKAYFYNDGTSPSNGDRETQALVERVLARFMLGCDVRRYIVHIHRKDGPPKTGAVYLDKAWKPRKVIDMLEASGPGLMPVGDGGIDLDDMGLDDL